MDLQFAARTLVRADPSPRYIACHSTRFCFRLCPSTAGSSPPLRVLHLSLSFAVLVHTAPCCPTMSSLQRHFGLPTDLTPFICHSVLPVVHLLSFIRAMCLASFDRLVGLVVRRPPRERKIPGSNPARAGIFVGVESYQ